MSLSKQPAGLNVHRYKEFEFEHTGENAKPAALAFNGDVYQGLQAETFDEKKMDFAQKHFRILSGLYGLLRPLDLIQPYRLEMGTKLAFDDHKTLYRYIIVLHLPYFLTGVCINDPSIVNEAISAFTRAKNSYVHG